jgi:hypothetical protein
MIKSLKAMIRRMRCRRHRWRPDRRRPGGEWCDMCGARRKASAG